MTWSACQNKGVSCGACCGIFNLKLTADERRSLIDERGRDFRLVDLKIPHMIAGYRRAREAKEEGIERGNPEIYVCPYYGPIADGTLSGCMIHPSLTGNPHSQNFSFYGTSICQAYDCPPKDKDSERRWAGFLRASFPDQDNYGRLMADTLFYDVLARAGLFECFEKGGEGFRGAMAEAVRSLCKARLATAASQTITSFELKMTNFPSLEDELFYLLELGEKNLAAKEEGRLTAASVIHQLRELIRAHQDSPRDPTEKRSAEDSRRDS
ncbi:MAG: hypothetical protein HY042_02830 [Spirochaetia bacterium]|nr:hypothetical protein [Spirochaetia bacterium]